MTRKSFGLYLLITSLIFISMFQGTARARLDAGCKVLDPDLDFFYEGDCLNGLACGKGLARGRDTYEGNFKKGLPDGKGLYTWYNGDVYDGDWADGKQNGWGTLKIANGNYYEGEWKNGERHGNGAFRWSDGSYYEGEWRNDLRQGLGVFYGADKSYYKGHWKNNLQDGPGFYRWPDGKTFQGEWKKGKIRREYKKRVDIMLDEGSYKILVSETRKTGETMTAVIERALQTMKARERGKTKK